MPTLENNVISWQSNYYSLGGKIAFPIHNLEGKVLNPWPVSSMDMGNRLPDLEKNGGVCTATHKSIQGVSE